MKSWAGRYFEDFFIGQEIPHANELTVSEASASIYRSLTGLRFSTQCSEPFAQSLGFRTTPVDDVFVLKILFGQSVRDVSLRAVATLGYGGCAFDEPVYPGDTLRSATTVIGLELGPSDDTGIVHVRTTGRNQRRDVVASYVRWVSIRRREASGAVKVPPTPVLPQVNDGLGVPVPSFLTTVNYDTVVAGSPYYWEDYSPGERIDHVDGCTIEESEATMVARLYQNTAPPHYNAHAMAQTPFGRRIVFVGHIVGLTRSLSYNGLANVFRVAVINRARHLQPTFAGTTVYAWTEVLERLEIPGRTDVGALRLRSVATKDRACHDFPDSKTGGEAAGSVVLEWDYIGLIPRRQS